MRALAFALVLVALPAGVGAQAAGSPPAPAGQTVFSIQPWHPDVAGPRLELERVVMRKLSVVLGAELALSKPLGEPANPAVSRADIGVRYYTRGPALSGAFVGLYGGYDRVIKGYTLDQYRRVPTAFGGATLGYNFVLFRRVIVAPAFGFEYGRQTPSGGGRAFNSYPRIGFGIAFE
ncbi:MAG TPA: hypothetical protein VF761_02585 [Gemmatimonadaceae bacterium]